MLWSDRHGKAARLFLLIPRWASKPLTHSLRGGQGAAPDLGGPRATPCIPGVMGEREEGREVPTHARVSAALMDEQRQFMVLELYYRKAGGKREGRKRVGGRLERKSKRERGEDKERGERKESKEREKRVRE